MSFPFLGLQASCFQSGEAFVQLCEFRILLRPQLPKLVAGAAAHDWEPDFLCCALAAIAAAKGQPGIAAAVLELTPEGAEEFMAWLIAR